MNIDSLEKLEVALIGAGNIAEAFIRGVLGADLLRPEQIHVTNRSCRERLQKLQDSFGVQIHKTKKETVRKAAVVVLAVKPKDAPEALDQLSAHVTSDQIVLSLMAGVEVEYIAKKLPEGIPVLRSMPNTSSLIRESATALATGPHATREHEKLCETLLCAVGSVVTVNEHDLDAVTGLSGSGPAYVYLMIEALVQAGEQSGLRAELARELAVQTVYGAAKMVRDTGTDPSELRHRVMSPGGTTVEGLRVLEEQGFVASLTEAVARAAHRSRELRELSP